MVAPIRLGPYVLHEQVSAGAFSVTYRAEHADLGRAALIKTLKPTVSARGAIAAGLEREARVLGRVRHPSFVEIYDFRREGDAIWLVLEALAGPTLAELCARAGRLDPDAAAAIALELARGLAHAHERGVVHCALRPEHVVITPGGGVKILELSAAHDARVASEDAPRPEALDGAFARPQYMAPEQILGDPPAPPVDVFALGVALYEMLTGERPFDPPDDEDAPRPREGAARAARGLPAPRAPTASSPDIERRAVAHRIRHEPPRPLRTLAPGTPRSLERVVLRCLEKDAELRYPDGRAVAAALDEAIAERTQTPGHVFIARALAAAKLGDDPAGLSLAPARTGPRVPHAPAPPRDPPARSFAPELRHLGAVFALIVLGGAIVELGLRDDDLPTVPSAEAAGASQHGYLRFLARPWAEVILDGDLLDVTPIGRAIPVPPGRHYITFRHPSAPEEKREVLVAAGQTVLLDVTLRIDRSVPDAGAARPDGGDSP